jgi:hypothetical protein
LELITPDKRRENFLDIYEKLNAKGLILKTKEELEEEANANPVVFRDIKVIYHELVKQNNEALRSFLDGGASEILAGIRKMEEHLRALDTTETIKPTETPFEIKPGKPSEMSSDIFLKLLREKKTSEFNRMRGQFPTLRIDFSRLHLPEANLSNLNLVDVNLSKANLSGANLSRAYLSRANLSKANLSCVDFSNADLSDADLSSANLRG